MKIQALKEMATEELQKKLKTQKMMTGILLGLVFVMFVVTFLPTLAEQSIAQKILPFAFIPLLVVNFLSIKKMKKELELRQSQ